MKKVAITGQLASGKSSLCKIFESFGAYVTSADQITHRLLSPSTVLGQRILDEFGSDILKEAGFDRKKIAEIAFSNPEKLEILEALIHPAVFDEIEKLYRKIKIQNQYTLFIAEIPLFYESKIRVFYDAVIVITADIELCRKRFQESTGYDTEEYDKRMKRQLPQEVKKAQTPYTIVNNGSLIELKEKAKKLYAFFSKEV